MDKSGLFTESQLAAVLKTRGIQKAVDALVKNSEKGDSATYAKLDPEQRVLLLDVKNECQQRLTVLSAKFRDPHSVSHVQGREAKHATKLAQDLYAMFTGSSSV